MFTGLDPRAPHAHPCVPYEALPEGRKAATGNMEHAAASRGTSTEEAMSSGEHTAATGRTDAAAATSKKSTAAMRGTSAAETTDKWHTTTMGGTSAAAAAENRRTEETRATLSQADATKPETVPVNHPPYSNKCKHKHKQKCNQSKTRNGEGKTMQERQREFSREKLTRAGDIEINPGPTRGPAKQQQQGKYQDPPHTQQQCQDSPHIRQQCRRRRNKRTCHTPNEVEKDNAQKSATHKESAPEKNPTRLASTSESGPTHQRQESPPKINHPRSAGDSNPDATLQRQQPEGPRWPSG